MEDERHLIVVGEVQALSTLLDDALDVNVISVERGSDFDVTNTATVGVVAREMSLLERLRAAGFKGALILSTERSGAPRLRARRAGIAVFTEPEADARIIEALACALSKEVMPRLECASCHTTTNITPRSISGIVFFCEDCQAIASADPADPRVDIGGPG